MHAQYSEVDGLLSVSWMNKKFFLNELHKRSIVANIDSGLKYLVIIFILVFLVYLSVHPYIHGKRSTKTPLFLKWQLEKKKSFVT